jgi:N,N'-diacetyllegionaminate synthase
VSNLERPALIAELCQNHLGDRVLLTDMVHAAVEAGADILKIQALYSADLTRRSRFENGSISPDGQQSVIRRPYKAEYERLSVLDLTPDDEQYFVELCHSSGVQAMVTVFTRAAIPRLSGYGFDAVKIASYDCASYPLLREAAVAWNKMVVSTGSMFSGEVERAFAELKKKDPERDLTFLHCVTIYPTPLNMLALGRINFLTRLTGKAGFSDHTHFRRDGLWASKAALAAGATAIERHFTILEAEKTKDGPVSIPPSALAELRRFGDSTSEEQVSELNASRPEWREWFGRPPYLPAEEELRNRDYYQGRVASVVNGRLVYNWEDIDLGVIERLPGLSGEKERGL